MSNELEELLNKLGTIHYKYSILEKNNKFNVFELMHKSYDEVNLHSKFLSELLKPHGMHGMGNVFLEEFIFVLNKVSKKIIKFDFKEKTNVQIEKFIGTIDMNYDSGGRIDILIENDGSYPIIIENKIYAEDQRKQLLRYYKYNPQGHIIYLTLYGTEPTDDALGGLSSDNILLLSYKYHIANWIEKCIEKASTNPTLRETLVQYKSLIENLTGNSMSKYEFNEIYKLISQNDNIINARLIGDNWNKIKIQTELEFWETLKETIESSSHYKILQKSIFSKEEIRKVVFKQKGARPYYGLVFKLGSFQKVDIHFKIERGYRNLFYGFIIDGEELGKNLRPYLNSFISKYCSEQNNHIYIGGAYIQNLDFEKFSSDDTLKMCNTNFRNTQVLHYWQVIKSFINNCEDEFGSDYIKEI